MPGLLWKVPLTLMIALPVAAAALVMRARSDSPQSAEPLPAALRPPPDGLSAIKAAAENAAEIEAVRAAIREFNINEGHPPADLAELAQSRYLDYALTKPNLRNFRYDPTTMTVTRIAR